MAHGRLRVGLYQPGFALALGCVGASAVLLDGCAPSSGSPSDLGIPTLQAGGAGAGHPGGGHPNAGAAGVVMGQGGITGGGGIIPQGGFGNGGFGNGGFDPGAGGSFGGGGALPGDGGAWGSSGGTPQGAGGTCGMNQIDPTTYPACTTCTGGRCVPTDQLTGAPVQLLAACDSTNACVPEQIVAQGENLLLRACTSLGGSEGRCTSLCIPAASNLKAYLPQDVCTSDERCVPCYSPNDGSAIGVCGLGCDRPPIAPPYIFGTCCSGAGRCAPSSALPPDTAKNLGPETCQSGDLCVPAKPIADPAFRFQCCTANNASGICAPACVITQTSQGKLLTQGSCASDERCVPCKNPLTGAPLGSCTDTTGNPVTTCVP
jgi:hypothetical protein